MRYLSLEEIIGVHAKVIAQSGGSLGLRDRGALESAVAQPQMTFAGEDLYLHGWTTKGLKSRVSEFAQVDLAARCL